MRLTLASFSRAIRAARAHSRFRLALRLIPQFFTSPATATAQVWESGEHSDYKAGYDRMAELLKVREKVPPAGEAEFVEWISQQAIRYPGCIGAEDVAFLTAIISLTAPRRVLEVGTASGFSAAVIAAALNRQAKGAEQGRLDTIDLHPRYYADPALPVGYAISELVPEFASLVHVHTPCGAEYASQIARRSEIDLAFIDANHQHPCPLLDLLHVAPVIKRGGWVLLHDVRLGTLGRAARGAGKELEAETPFGAEWLFDRWTFPKFRARNIGAIHLPDNRAAMIPLALQLMKLPFETNLRSHAGLKRDLHASFAGLQ